MADDLQAVVPRDLGGGEGQRGEQVVPRQPALVAVQAGLGAQPAAERRQRIDHGGLHGIERWAADAVGEQRGVQRAGPTAAAVHHVGLALHAVHGGSAGGGHLRPCLHLGVVGGAADGRVGVGSQAAHGGDRQVLRAVGQGDGGGELGGDHALELAPGGGAGGDQLGVQALFDFAHLVLGAVGQLGQRAVVLGDGGADGGELVDAEGGHPRSEAGGEGAGAGGGHAELGLQPLGPLVERVGGGERGDVGLGDVRVGEVLVEGGDHGVGVGAVLRCHRPRVGGADVALVEQRLQAGDVGVGPVHRVEEGAGVERLVDVGDVPAGEGVVGGGHRGTPG